MNKRHRIGRPGNGKIVYFYNKQNDCLLYFGCKYCYFNLIWFRAGTKRKEAIEELLKHKKIVEIEKDRYAHKKCKNEEYAKGGLVTA
jgi:NifB/MoaA-like Fe-S oxidoreductase